ncbi:MAG: hypothetical protein R2792_03810 [Saprospiraceae bacterium]
MAATGFENNNSNETWCCNTSDGQSPTGFTFWRSEDTRFQRSHIGTAGLYGLLLRADNDDPNDPK